PGNVDDDAVEHPSSGPVQVQPAMEELAEEAPALGDTECERVVNTTIGELGTSPSETGDEVPDREQAGANDRALPRAVAHLVGTARLEPALQPDAGVVRHYRAVNLAREAPTPARDHEHRALCAVPNGQDGPGVLGVPRPVRPVGPVGQAGGRIERPVAQPLAGRPPVRLERD